MLVDFVVTASTRVIESARIALCFDFLHMYLLLLLHLVSVFTRTTSRDVLCDGTSRTVYKGRRAEEEELVYIEDLKSHATNDDVTDGLGVIVCGAAYILRGH